MKVFISWSGPVSHKAAVVLRDWLPSVIQSLEPYVSSEDIDKGARWGTDIAGELSASNYGILCVTKDNISAPWLNFEAGALSKAFDQAQVAPLLIGVKRSEVKDGPLLQFQSVICEKEDVLKLLMGMNAAQTVGKLDPIRLNGIFEVWWPRLHAQFEDIEKIAQPAPPKGARRFDAADIAEEMLELLRQQSRILNNPELLLPVGYLSVALGGTSNGPVKRNLRDLIGQEFRAFEDFMLRFGALRSAAQKPDATVEELKLLIENARAPLIYLAGRMFDGDEHTDPDTATRAQRRRMRMALLDV